MQSRQREAARRVDGGADPVHVCLRVVACPTAAVGQEAGSESRRGVADPSWTRTANDSDPLPPVVRGQRMDSPVTGPAGRCPCTGVGPLTGRLRMRPRALRGRARAVPVLCSVSCCNDASGSGHGAGRQHPSRGGALAARGTGEAGAPRASCDGAARPAFRRTPRTRTATAMPPPRPEPTAAFTLRVVKARSPGGLLANVPRSASGPTAAPQPQPGRCGPQA